MTSPCVTLTVGPGTWPLNVIAEYVIGSSVVCPIMGSSTLSPVS